jgi:hypothetical protein
VFSVKEVGDVELVQAIQTIDGTKAYMVDHESGETREYIRRDTAWEQVLLPWLPWPLRWLHECTTPARSAALHVWRSVSLRS